ncbi:MAG TPA: MFS transporter, partial [Gemmatimonadales bacterium]|nr:MFS transporter [Gemmatimonadales bacterium]
IRGRAFGFHRAMDHAGATVGPLIAALLLAQAGMRPGAVIAWAALPGAVAVAVVWLAMRRIPATASEASELHGPPAAPLAASRLSSPLLACVVGFAFARLPETLFLLRLQDLGVSVAVVPVMWALLHVVRTSASYPGGWLSDHIGPKRTMQSGWLLYATVCGGLAWSSTAMAGAAWFLAFGLVAGATEASERTLVAALGGAERRGRAFGAYHAAVGVAALPGGLVLGAIYSAFGGAVALLASGAAGAVLAVAALGTRDSSPTTPPRTRSGRTVLP